MIKGVTINVIIKPARVQLFNHGARSWRVLTMLFYWCWNNYACLLMMSWKKRLKYKQTNRKHCVQVVLRSSLTFAVLFLSEPFQVDNVNSFEWVKQLRYYWDPDLDNCVVRMSNSLYIYGYEYLGASPRLVITPLTVSGWCMQYLCLYTGLVAYVLPGWHKIPCQRIAWVGMRI